MRFFLRPNRINRIFFFCFFSAIFFNVLVVASDFPSERRKTIAIIGGGMSGVSASFFLQNSGMQVHLFEKEEQLGGHAITRDIPTGIGDKTIPVDLGPQYFADKGWETYKDMLRYLGLGGPKHRTTFASSMAIFQQDKVRPILYTPTWDLSGIKYILSPQQMKNNLKLSSFIENSFSRIYCHPQGRRDLSAGEWLSQLGVTQRFKNQVLRPILMSLSNTDMENIDGTSMLYLTQAISFRPPRDHNFYVSKLGLGRTIQMLAQKVQNSSSPRVQYHLGAAIQKIERDKKTKKYKLTDSRGGVLMVDELVLALHPFQAAKIDMAVPQLDPLIKLWPQFTYNPVTIAIHHDRKNYVRSDLNRFFNILKRGENDYAVTMNLRAIHPKYGQILKTWVRSDRELQELKDKGVLLSSATYQHPIVTPTFLRNQKIMMNFLQKNPELHLHIIGGWTTLFESQNTAILTAYRMAKGFLDQKEQERILQLFPSLSDGLEKLAQDEVETPACGALK